MQALRFLFLFSAFFGLGLFLQPSAYASAHSTIAASAVSHCGMMSVDETSDSVPGEGNDCEDMQFDCVFSTTCISPLYKPEETPFARSLTLCEHLYAPLSSDEPLTSSRGPEPPPPQSRS